MFVFVGLKKKSKMFKLLNNCGLLLWYVKVLLVIKIVVEKMYFGDKMNKYVDSKWID